MRLGAARGRVAGGGGNEAGRRLPQRSQSVKAVAGKSSAEKARVEVDTDPADAIGADTSASVVAPPADKAVGRNSAAAVMTIAAQICNLSPGGIE